MVEAAGNCGQAPTGLTKIGRRPTLQPAWMGDPVSSLGSPNEPQCDGRQCEARPARGAWSALTRFRNVDVPDPDRHAYHRPKHRQPAQRGDSRKKRAAAVRNSLSRQGLRSAPQYWSRLRMVCCSKRVLISPPSVLYCSGRRPARSDTRRRHLKPPDASRGSAEQAWSGGDTVVEREE
jgi:hypothetical protein